MEFNINYEVEVKLTVQGIRILENRHNTLMEDIPVNTRLKFKLPKVDKDGYTKFQLWTLMNTFGTHMSLGSEPPFDTVIKIPTT